MNHTLLQNHLQLTTPVRVKACSSVPWAVTLWPPVLCGSVPSPLSLTACIAAQLCGCPASRHLHVASSGVSSPRQL